MTKKPCSNLHEILHSDLHANNVSQTEPEVQIKHTKQQTCKQIVNNKI